MYALSPEARKVLFQKEARKWYNEFRSSLAFTEIRAIQQDVLNVFWEDPTFQKNQEFGKQGSSLKHDEKDSPRASSSRQTIVPKVSLWTFFTTRLNKHCSTELDRSLWCSKTFIQKHHIKASLDRLEIVGKPEGQEKVQIRETTSTLNLN